ncbi:MAG: hypothetical protein WAZ30_08070 [Syntrophorhabdus sp.]
MKKALISDHRLRAEFSIELLVNLFDPGNHRRLIRSGQGDLKGISALLTTFYLDPQWLRGWSGAVEVLHSLHLRSPPQVHSCRQAILAG